MKEQTLQVFCSLNWRHKDAVRLVFRYLQDEYKAKHEGVELPNLDKWKLHYSTPYGPTQTNNYDCGVFVCMTADFLANGWPLIYSQDQVDSCRIRIAHGILNDCAITTKAVTMLTEEIWSLRYRIIYAVLLQRDRFLSLMKGEICEADETMCTITSGEERPRSVTKNHSFQWSNPP